MISIKARDFHARSRYSSPEQNKKWLRMKKMKSKKWPQLATKNCGKKMWAKKTLTAQFFFWNDSRFLHFYSTLQNNEELSFYFYY
jgi:hypothetical protein